jgi:hypothetical protein
VATDSTDTLLKLKFATTNQACHLHSNRPGATDNGPSPWRSLFRGKLGVGTDGWRAAPSSVDKKIHDCGRAPLAVQIPIEEVYRASLVAPSCLSAKLGVAVPGQWYEQHDVVGIRCI